MRMTLVRVALLSAGLSGAACGRPPQAPPAEATAPLVRSDIHAAYLKDNAAGHEWFAHASDGYSGVPLVLLRSLPDLAPEIWGKADEQFARFGYLPNPGGPLPLGLSWDSMDPGVTPQPLHPVALTCGACHIGRVKLDDGTSMTLVGGPNTEFDVRMWRKAFERTVHEHLGTPADVTATAARLQKTIVGQAGQLFLSQRPRRDCRSGSRRAAIRDRQRGGHSHRLRRKDSAGGTGHQQTEGDQLQQGQCAAARRRQPRPVRRQRRSAAATAAARHRDQPRSREDDGGLHGHVLQGAPRTARHVHRHPQHLEARVAAHRPGGWQREVAVLPQHRGQRRGGRRSEDGECPQCRGDRAVHQPAAAAALSVRDRCRGRGAWQGDLHAELCGVPPRVQRHRLPDRSDRHRSESLARAECGRPGALPPALRRQRAGRL